MPYGHGYSDARRMATGCVWDCDIDVGTSSRSRAGRNALVRCTLGFSGQGVIGCRDQGSPVALREAHARQAGRLRPFATGRTPVAWVLCSPWSWPSLLAVGRTRDGSEERRSRLRSAQCPDQRARSAHGNRRAQGSRHISCGTPRVGRGSSRTAPHTRDRPRVRLHADLTILAKLSCALARARAVPLTA
jgi:hypothetical protein